MTAIGGLGGAGLSQVQRHGFKPPTFDQLDSNSDGSITLDELVSAAPAGANSTRAQERAQKLFTAMDSDADGKVTSSEKDAFDLKLQDQRQGMNFLAQQLAGGQKPPSDDDVFAATDSNGDGSVDLAELANDPAAKGTSTDAMQKLFDLIDANGDGSISKDESSAFLDAVKSAVGQATGQAPAAAPPPPPPAADTADNSSSQPFDLMSLAQNAYQSTAKSTDLLSILSNILQQAA